MHEIRATVPAELVDEVVRIIKNSGVSEVTTTEVFIRGPETKRIQCSVETSTPRAHAMVKELTRSELLKNAGMTLTSREVRAILDATPVEEITRPMSEPQPDVIQDLWQLSHVTWSYFGRALAGAILLGSGIIEDNPIAIVVAALFLPFLSQVLAVGIGLWCGDRKLAFHGLKAVGLSILLSVLGGAIVAAVEGGPIGFHGFKGPLSSLAISAAIGFTAGLSQADDAGRRYLVGVAAAVQLAVFPVWMGAAIVVGYPGSSAVLNHMLSFGVNLITIPAVSVLAYAYAHVGRSRRTGSR
jgi:hypothetical protein